MTDGTERVRIGRPLRREFAARRYGDPFGRRLRQIATTGGALATRVCVTAAVRSTSA